MHFLQNMTHPKMPAGAWLEGDINNSHKREGKLFYVKCPKKGFRRKVDFHSILNHHDRIHGLRVIGISQD